MMIPGSLKDAPDQAPGSSAHSLTDQIDKNIHDVATLYEREQGKLPKSHRGLERLCAALARPAYLFGVLCFTLVWIAADLAGRLLGLGEFDRPPFQWLQGILTLVALITAIVILIAQTRQTGLERLQAQLQLQVNLLSEQKITKVIHLLEELRRDLPMVRDRQDPQAASLQQAADTRQLLEALDKAELAEEQEKSK